MLSIFSLTPWLFVGFIRRNTYSDPLLIFKLGHLSFVSLSQKNFLYILVKIPLTDIGLTNSFFHSVDCLFPWYILQYEDSRGGLLTHHLPDFARVSSCSGVLF